ncbi:hypothetical protein BDW62DRAFT_70510 [Aspergillus aurantiobrunneus]
MDNNAPAGARFDARSRGGQPVSMVTMPCCPTTGLQHLTVVILTLAWVVARWPGTGQPHSRSGGGGGGGSALLVVCASSTTNSQLKVQPAIEVFGSPPLVLRGPPLPGQWHSIGAGGSSRFLRRLTMGRCSSVVPLLLTSPPTLTTAAPDFLHPSDRPRLRVITIISLSSSLLPRVPPPQIDATAWFLSPQASFAPSCLCFNLLSFKIN